jgi:TPR repeat protein
MYRLARFKLVVLSLGLSCSLAAVAQADAYERASHYIEKGDDVAAMHHLRRGARDGDVRCQFLLGVWYLSGTVVEADPEAAAQLLKRAAAQDLPIAQSYVGVLYSEGLGVEADSHKAAKWFERAAMYGDPLGQAALGIAAYLGDGIPEDHVEAYKWIRLSAAQGNERAAKQEQILEQVLSPDEIREGKDRADAFQPTPNPLAVSIKPHFNLFDGNASLRHSTSGSASH